MTYTPTAQEFKELENQNGQLKTLLGEKDLEIAIIGVLIIDEDLVPEPPKGIKVIKVPITRLAVEKLGKELFTNIVALGILVKVTGAVSFETIQKAVAKRVPPATIEKNMEALRIGYESV